MQVTPYNTTKCITILMKLLKMKKYRIKSYYNSTYIIEKRFWLFWWFPVRTETYLLPSVTPKIFTSITEARN